MHIVWDWNGTLFDDHHLVVDAVNASLSSLGAAPIDSEYYRTHFVRPLNDFYARALDREVGPDLMDEIDDVFQAAYADGFSAAGMTADAAEALGRAAEAGASQSIASMLWHDLLVSAVTRFDVDRFMLAVDGHRGLAGETKEAHLTHHVERLESLFSVERQGMVVIGDITDDAVAARAAGIPCILYDGGSQMRETLEAEAVPVASSLVEAVEIALSSAR